MRWRLGWWKRRPPRRRTSEAEHTAFSATYGPGPIVPGSISISPGLGPYHVDLRTGVITFEVPPP